MASLSEDLIVIRKGQKKSINDLYESTRIPIPTIEQIESGVIFTNLANNPVYLRSFIRTYAKALKISDDDILRSLDEQMGKGYSGFLLKKYMPGETQKQTPEVTEKQEDKSTPSDSDTTDKDKTELSKSEKSEDYNREEAKAPGQRKKFFTPENLNPKGKTIQDIEEEDQEAKKTQHTSTSYTQDPSNKKIENVDWASVVKKSRGFGGNYKWITGIVLIFLLTVGLFLFWKFFLGDDVEVSDIDQIEQMAPETTAPATMDTTNVADPETIDEDTDLETDGTQQIQIPEPETVEEVRTTGRTEIPVSEGLGEELEILIYAANDKLEPFFVGTENGTANAPYWIEHRTAMIIPFEEEINIRGQFSRMKVIFNGHEVVNYLEFYGDNRTVSIPRSYFEENEKWATPATEDEITYELPLEVIERP